MLFRTRLLGVTLWLVSARAAAQPSPRPEPKPDARVEAAAAYDDGRYEDALATLDAALVGGSAPRASALSYLRIRVLAALERWTDALEASKRPASDWPESVVRDLAERRIGWAASAGRCDEVEAQVAATRTKTADRLIARCAFAAKAHARVADLLASARDAEGRAMHIRALIELGRTDPARALARTFYVEQPASQHAARFRAYVEESGPLALTPEEHMRRAEGFLDARQPEVAVDELKPVTVARDKKLAARLWHLRGEALFRTRKRYPEASKAFARAATFRGDTEDYDVFHAARALSRAGDDRTAIKRYREFAARYKKSKLAPDALFLAAWLAVREKLPNASKDMEHFAASKHAAQSPSLRRDALWYLGFHAFERRAARQAKKWLESYEAVAERGMDRARAAYWLGRTALLARDEGEARVHFTRVLHEERLGYYAQLAARRLRALGALPPAFELSPPALVRPRVENLPSEVGFYADLGLYADAADAASRFVGTRVDTPLRIAALLEAGEASRLHAAAEPLADAILAGTPDATRTWAWTALLPRPYLTTVTAETTRHAIDPDLFYGHMQIESRYRPRVVSGADAIGLMQLLPETARVVAKEQGHDFTRADLLRPHRNVALGAAYLGSLLTRYARQFPVAIAAYNAGTFKVEEWLGRGEHELDRWVEHIPVEQTRNYVRRVIGAWSRYHALSDPHDPWTLPLPEKVSFPTR
ncbi:MAG: lytic transglycosylase domain-containing protein [Polyangiales bacterium]